MLETNRCKMYLNFYKLEAESGFCLTQTEDLVFNNNGKVRSESKKLVNLGDFTLLNRSKNDPCLFKADTNGLP